MNYSSFQNVPTLLTDSMVLARPIQLEKGVRTVYELADGLYKRCVDMCEDCIRENLGLCMDEMRGMVFVFEKNKDYLGEDYLTITYLHVLIKLEMNFQAVCPEKIPYDGRADFEQCMLLLQLLIRTFKEKNANQKLSQ